LLQVISFAESEKNPAIDSEKRDFSFTRIIFYPCLWLKNEHLFFGVDQYDRLSLFVHLFSMSGYFRCQWCVQLDLRETGLRRLQGR
jgi:hypothetical protein